MRKIISSLFVICILCIGFLFIDVKLPNFAEFEDDHILADPKSEIKTISPSFFIAHPSSHSISSFLISQSPTARQTTTDSPITTAPTIPLDCNANDSISELRLKLLQRLDNFKREHEENGNGFAVGWRGVSWIYHNLNHALIACPDLEHSITNDSNGALTLRFVDISIEQRCPPSLANNISMYVRLAGPEIIAVLAKPVIGKCEWEARFHLSIPGTYTAYARLLHFNGNQDHFQDGEAVRLDQVEGTLKLMFGHGIDRYPYYTTASDCRRMCTRLKECTYSMHFPGIRNMNLCYFFTKGDNYDGFNAIDTYSVIRENETDSVPQNMLIRKVPRFDFVNTFPIWQLGCGRDEFLLRWVPCASLKYESHGRHMKGVEDVILFEFENSNLFVPLSSAVFQTSLDSAQLEFDSPKKPKCDWKLNRLPDGGRWTRSPLLRTLKCGLEIPHVFNLFATSPRYSLTDDLLCTLRFQMDKLTQDSPKRFRWEGFPEFKDVWKTELSDSYVRELISEHNHPHIPGPLTAYWRYPPEVRCTMPRLRSPTEIRSCVIQRNLEFFLDGDSIVEFFSHYFGALLSLAFPEIPNLYKYGKKVQNFTVFRPSPTRVFITDFSIPNSMTYYNLDQNRQLLKSERALKIRKDASSFSIKVFLNVPFVVWERRQYLTAERSEEYSKLMREILLPLGWSEIDLNSLTKAFTMDSTLERDSLHIIGHSMVMAVQFLFDRVCS